MQQLGFDSAPALDAHIDFSAKAPDERIADPAIVSRLHRRSFVPMDPNNRGAGRVRRLQVLPTVLEPLPTPGTRVRQETAPSAAPEFMSAEQRDIRIREAAAVNELTLFGSKAVRPY